MIKSISIRALCTIGFLIALAATGRADVQGVGVNTAGYPGKDVMIPLQLVSSDSVAGINGQLVYDTNLFSNPRIVQGSGASGFVVLGNDVSNPAETGVGRFNFVVYADPTSTMDLSSPVVYFFFMIADNIPHTTIGNLLYQIAATSDPTAQSLATQFDGIHIYLNSTATGKSWALYE